MTKGGKSHHHHHHGQKDKCKGGSSTTSGAGGSGPATSAAPIVSEPEPVAATPIVNSSIKSLSSVEWHPVTSGVIRLMTTIEKYNGSTINGLIAELREEVKALEEGSISISVLKYKLALSSSCAQFIRYTTLYLSTIESEDLPSVKRLMLDEGRRYLKRCENAVLKVAKFGVPLIFDGARVMVHSYSRGVLETLLSVPDNIYFTVYQVTGDDDLTSAQLLKARSNVEYVRIRDSEVGTRMETIDLVFTGAEAVVKNGGIINKVGTLPTAICAREMNKPMYVFAESFKFSLLYPLSQADIPPVYRYDEAGRVRVDYTAPKYLTLLVTDRGLLTPVAVCDELIEMYT